MWHSSCHVCSEALEPALAGAQVWGSLVAVLAAYGSARAVSLLVISHAADDVRVCGADLLEEGDGEAAPEEVIAAPAEPEPTTATTAAQAEAERQRCVSLMQSCTHALILLHTSPLRQQHTLACYTVIPALTCTSTVSTTTNA